MRKLTLFASAIAFAVSASATFAEDNYPTRPITWVVPYGAGSVTDTVSRKVTSVLSEKLGQQVIVENRPGAGGVVGVESVASAAPDGYTVMYVTSGPFAILPHLRKGESNYDPIKSFDQIRGLAASAQLIVAHPDTPYDTLEELVEYAKANPGKINFGSPGNGSAQHLSGELFKSATGIDMMHVPYRVGTNQMVDLMAGVLDVSFEYITVVKPYIDEGKMKLLGTTAPSRMNVYPDAQTVVEAGYPDAVNLGWGSVGAPAGLSPEVLAKLSKAMEETLLDPSIIEFFEQNVLISMVEYDPQGMKDFIVDSNERFKKVIDEAKITLE